MRSLLFLIALLLISHSGFSQNIGDALRFSTYDHGGTARAIGIGGVVSAIGSDFSVLSLNPGGLGNYRSSEFVVTPFLNINSASSILNNSAAVQDSRLKFGFQNLGFVFHRQPRSAKWKTFNVGIGFNQRANYNQRFSYEGRSVGSIADRWLELAYDSGQAISPDNLDGFEAGLALQSFAIFDPDESDGLTEYFNDFFAAPDVLKRQEVTAKGSTNELLFSMAANYNNKISFGVTAGLPIVNYTLQKIYEEEDDGTGRDGDIPVFNSLRFVENLTTSGVGFTFKAGVTVRISQALRIGFAAHSPTRIRLNDTFYNLLTFRFNDSQGIPVNPSSPNASPDGSFGYRLTTPFRALGSFAYIFGKKGFLTGEIEYLDYSQNNFDLSLNDNSTPTLLYQRLLNDDIQTLLSSTINVRVGGEYVMGDYQARAGIGLLGNPYQGENGLNISYSVGLGYRTEGYYFDLAYRLFSYNEDYRPYNLVEDSNEPIVSIDGLSHQVTATLGFRF